MCSYVTPERLRGPKERIYGTCDKCNDRFVLHWGGRSERMPCRIHDWDIYGRCTCCQHNKSNYSGNCYHMIAEARCLRCNIS